MLNVQQRFINQIKIISITSISYSLSNNHSTLYFKKSLKLLVFLYRIYIKKNYMLM